MLIEVRASDIKAAKKDRKNGCPIEIAARRAFKCWVTAIGIDELFVGNGKSEIYALPTEAQSFAESFDAGVKVEPFTFSVDNAY